MSLSYYTTNDCSKPNTINVEKIQFIGIDSNYQFFKKFLDYIVTVKERYVNEPIPYPNESNPKDRRAKKSLKQMKMITYTNNVHIGFR